MEISGQKFGFGRHPMYDVKKYSTSKEAINSALYSSLVPVLNEQPTVTALSNHMHSHTHAMVLKI